jgi:hypothetical protein
MEYSQHSYSGNVTGNTNTKMGIPIQTAAYAGFEYTGKTSLTIRGIVTGTQYRFNFPGNRQNIDYRDIPGIAGIPVLKKVK